MKVEMSGPTMSDKAAVDLAKIRNTYDVIR